MAWISREGEVLHGGWHLPELSGGGGGGGWHMPGNETNITVSKCTNYAVPQRLL